MNNSHLDTAWAKLCGPLNAPHTCDKWKKTVTEMYSEPQRHYHTLNHIEEMLQLMLEYREKLQDEASVIFAVIFHDIVYDPKSSDNEERSAFLFREFAKEVGISLSMEEAVVDMINATKSHKTSAHESEAPHPQDLHYMLDLDMAVLGRPEEGYKVYAEQIRREYIHIPETTFCEKRAEVLNSFLKIPYIYASEEFRLRFETQARKNIQDEIDFLRQK